MPTDRSTRLGFRVEAAAEGSSARACRIITLHSEVLTPVFMPVATLAVLRTQNTASVEALGFPVLLANTYHLLLRPGTEVFKTFGGIHAFMNWKNSILTDSGGYQVFSLARTVQISEEGAAFRSYHDGRIFLLSPETSIETQRIIGSDIMMAMDQCVSSTSDRATCESAVETTARWAQRSLAAREDSPQALFGIVQGACSPELRRRSAGQITSLPFDGFAIGGLAVGEGDEERRDITELTASLLPAGSPRYLMGVGTPLDLLEAVHRGVDMFDCILPTALAQQGVAYTSRGRVELRRGVYKLSDRPLDAACTCPACRSYSRAYLHHLIKTGEYYGANLVGLHNLTFYRNLMASLRERIQAGDFASYYRTQRERLGKNDDEHPPLPPRRKKRKETSVLGSYEVMRQKGGFSSIRHTGSGEIMHSVTEPLVEARNLYVDQAGFRERLRRSDGGDFILWDVGLGAGTNAMAALLAYEEMASSGESLRGLSIFSFERDLDSLRLVLRNPSCFPHVRHAAPAALLRNGQWESDKTGIRWRLLEGDFRETMDAAPSPDTLYYDPFSLNTDGPLWEPQLFRRLYRRCAGRVSILVTYSASTRVRAALLASGFYVGKGAATGPKSETTVAFSSLHEGTYGIEMLGRDWLGRYDRSDASRTDTNSPEEAQERDRLVRQHPQFTLCN